MRLCAVQNTVYVFPKYYLRNLNFVDCLMAKLKIKKKFTQCI